MRFVVAIVFSGFAAVCFFGNAYHPHSIAQEGGPEVKLILIGDGTTDNTRAIQNAIDKGVGNIRFPKGVFRITKTIVIDLDRVGPTSISSDGTATIVMAGSGPAFRFIGTHEGTAAPGTVQPNVWTRQRTPMVDGIEIVGDHAEASGIEATGTMQLTITRTVVRDAKHGIHLVKRNRNVIISDCHLYNNRGIGVFLDHLNLHQINIIGSHISYNDGGGIVSRHSEIRNLQIGTCDIEGNMGDGRSAPTANVLIDATDTSIGEVAIVGCTIQHSHKAPNSANIRINGRSTKRPFTNELRHGNVTISGNVLSDVQINIELQDVRAATVTGNTMWKGYQHNLLIVGCDGIVVANNVLDRNPRYHYSDGADSQLSSIFRDCSDCVISGNLIKGVGEVPAAVELHSCRRMNIVGNTIVDYGTCGLLLNDLHDSRVTDCLIRDDRDGFEHGVAVQVIGGSGNQFDINK